MWGLTGFKNTPIRKKLMGVILLTSALVLSMMCVTYIVLEYYSFRETIKRDINVLGNVIASNISGALAFQSQADAMEILQALKAEEHIVSACLYNQEGRIFAYYPASADTTIFPEFRRGQSGYHFMGNYLEGYQPVVQKSQHLGVLFIRSDLQAMYDQLNKYILIGLLLITGSMLVAFAVSRILQSSISEPILALEENARIISEKKDYTVRATKYYNDEVGSLTDAFNQMLTEIQTQNAAITAFSQNLEKKVKERTAALQEQKDFIETIINSSVDLIAVFDEQLNYIMLNKRADDYYSIPRSEIIGKNILEVFPQLENSKIVDDLKRAATGETVYDKNYYSQVVNRRFENFYIPLRNKYNEVYGVLTIGHDISNITEAQEQLEMLNSELLKSNRDLEQFAYVASHDLQEPLRKIQTFTQLMNEFGDDPEKVKIYQQKIKQAASRMQQLIKDVLNFSRTANSDEAFTECDLNSIMENLKSDFELVFQEKNAVLRYAPLPVIPGIPLQLTQLFANLISNSLKYNEQQPHITIEADTPEDETIKSFPRLNPSLPYIRIRLTDNGIGFEQEFHEQIFNIFQRLHGRTTYSGTGIGLALCKKITENHKGVIFANSVLGEGSTFTIILPALPNLHR